MLFEAVIGCGSLDFCRLWLTSYWLAGSLTAVRGEWLKRGRIAESCCALLAFMPERMRDWLRGNPIANCHV
jgi:hypothetical protein